MAGIGNVSLLESQLMVILSAAQISPICLSILERTKILNSEYRLLWYLGTEISISL